MLRDNCLFYEVAILFEGSEPGNKGYSNNQRGCDRGRSCTFVVAVLPKGWEKGQALLHDCVEFLHRDFQGLVEAVEGKLRGSNRRGVDRLFRVLNIGGTAIANALEIDRGI